MSKMIQLRNVPDALHRSLKARAAMAGMSLSDYLLAEIKEVAEIVTRAVARGEYVAGFEHFVDYWTSPAAAAEVPAYKRFAMAARLPKIALEFHATLNEPARLEDFRSMNVPTLLIHGTGSPWPTRRICDLLERILPHAQLKTVGGAGHMSPVTHRDQVNALIMAQVESNSRHPSRKVRELEPALT